MAKRRRRATRSPSTKKHALTPTELKVLEDALNDAGTIGNLGSPGTKVKDAVQRMRDSITDKIKNPEQKRDLEIPLLLYSYFTQEWLPNYATVDYEHIDGVHGVLESIKAYIVDTSLKRPLNFLLLASPGSGKSHLIKSIAQHLRDQKVKVSDVTFNMATMRSKSDLGQVLDRARNIAIEHQTPLIFLDEFDSDERNYPLLLPLLWDGSLDVGHRDLRLGRSIFFLAGSRKALSHKLDLARDMSDPRSAQKDDTKLLDLFSRISGTVVRLPVLSDVTKNHLPDKFVVAMSLLRNRFQSCYRVPWSLLWFLVKAQFRYDARSIATLINNIPLVGGEQADTLPVLTKRHVQRLPLASVDALMQSALAFHLVDGNAASGLVELWQRALRYRTNQLLRFPPIVQTPELPNWFRHTFAIITKRTTEGIWPD
jgi:hypothetical protein